MTPDQWFTLWMTLIQTVGGGLVALGGVALGFLFAKRTDKKQRWNSELSYWTNELGGIYRRFLAAQPTTEQEAYDAIIAISDDLLLAHKSHPTPRGSVGDALMLPIFLAVGAASEIVPSPERSEVQARPPASPEAGSNYLAAVAAWESIMASALELAQAWSRDGLSQRKIDRALKTRIEQIGIYVRVPDDRKQGPSTKWGGW